MILRKYRSSDCKGITELFYQTVHAVSAKDYMEEQRNVWATGQADLAAWDQFLQEHYSVAAALDSTEFEPDLSGESMKTQVASTSFPML